MWVMQPSQTSWTGSWCLYINGILIAAECFSNRGYPLPLTRINSYIGGSNWGDLPVQAVYDAFRVYNYSVPAKAVQRLADLYTPSDMDLCQLTFDDGQSLPQHYCPPMCIQLLQDKENQSSAHIYGSFPYTTNSSICLAAIHAGIITNTDGGWVFATHFAAYHQPVILDLTDSAADTHRFLVNETYVPVIANISLLEIFPFNSSTSSYSNGIQSLSVINNFNGVTNVSLLNYSFIVYGRGVIAPTRQLTPFQNRSGHVHAYQPGKTCISGTTSGCFIFPHFHLILGGRNDTHYFNDVWIGEQLPHTPDYAPISSSFIQWYRLPDAPWTGRSNVNYQKDIYCAPNGPCSVAQLNGASVLFTFTGGQTGHHCGLHQLSICSNEIWHLNVTRNDSSPLMGLTFTWSLLPSHLPFPARCGAADVPRQCLGCLELVFAAMIGGQLSYTDPTCQAPIITVNEVYYSFDVLKVNWTQYPNAPFSPRSGLMAGMEWVMCTAPGVVDDCETVLLSGGVRHLNHSVSNGIARLSEVEIYTDGWICVSYFLDQPCVWLYNNQSSGNHAASGNVQVNYVMRSLPVPIVDGRETSMDYSMFESDYDVRFIFGGRTSKQAMNEWKNTQPPLYIFNDSVTREELLTNVTLIHQPGVTIDISGSFGVDVPYLADIMISRYQLPLMEINDS